MKAPIKRVLGLHPKHARRTRCRAPWEPRPFCSTLGVEILEDRTLPAVSILGIPVPDLPPAANFGNTQLTQVPLTVDVRLPPPLGQVFGDQSDISFQVPLPDFLIPAGTATLATPATGAVTVTGFNVDNNRLNQQ